MPVTSVSVKVNSQVDDRLNEIHDYFNILTLPLICYLHAWHMNILYSQPTDEDRITWLSLPRESANSQAWNCLYWAFFVYITADTFWIILYPRCVASPKVIIAHHLVCSVGWQMVQVWPGWEFYASAGLCVGRCSHSHTSLHLGHPHTPSTPSDDD